MTLGFKSRGSEFIDRKSTLAFVIPAQSLPRTRSGAGIQVTDSVRHTVEKRYPDSGDRGWTPVFTGVTLAAGMTNLLFA